MNGEQSNFSMAVLPREVIDNNPQVNDEFFDRYEISYRGIMELVVNLQQNLINKPRHIFKPDPYGDIQDALDSMDLIMVLGAEDYEAKRLRLVNICFMYFVSIHDFLEEIPQRIDNVYPYKWVGDKMIIGIRG